jgi:hypothetical protein
MSKPTLISSQRHINPAIVAEKLADEDYAVLVSPVFEIDGDEYQVVLDGHHSYMAAKQAGVDADLTVATATDHDAVGELIDGRIDDFLLITHMGSDYYDINTGKDVW